jgi:hypothetical protein
MPSSALPTLATAELQQHARKSQQTEVFVRDWHEVSPGTHAVTLHWPRTHDFYTLRSGATSPMLFVESVRQALAVLTNSAHGIPLDHRLGWESVQCTLSPAALRPRTGPAVVELRITHSDISRRRLGSIRVAAQIDATCDGEPLGTSRIRYITYPPAIYNRLRREYADAGRAFAAALPPAPPVTPSLVDRTAPADVVIAPGSTPHRYQLRTDTTHSVLFDHPHDHVPGMVLLEAATQAVQASTPERAPRTVAFDATFLRYVEFDAVCRLDVEPAAPDEHDREQFLVRGSQNDQEVFTTTVTLADDPGDLVCVGDRPALDTCPPR